MKTSGSYRYQLEIIRVDDSISKEEFAKHVIKIQDFEYCRQNCCYWDHDVLKEYSINYPDLTFVIDVLEIDDWIESIYTCHYRDGEMVFKDYGTIYYT